jgi:hypothetical protein
LNQPSRPDYLTLPNLRPVFVFDGQFDAPAFVFIRQPQRLGVWETFRFQKFNLTPLRVMPRV